MRGLVWEKKNGRDTFVGKWARRQRHRLGAAKRETSSPGLFFPNPRVGRFTRSGGEKREPRNESRAREGGRLDTR